MIRFTCKQLSFKLVQCFSTIFKIPCRILGPVRRLYRQRWHYWYDWGHSILVYELQKYVTLILKNFVNPFHGSLLIPPENIRKPVVFWCFQGVSKEISGMKWVKQNIVKIAFSLPWGFSSFRILRLISANINKL